MKIARVYDPGYSPNPSVMLQKEPCMVQVVLVFVVRVLSVKEVCLYPLRAMSVWNQTLGQEGVNYVTEYLQHYTLLDTRVYAKDRTRVYVANKTQRCTRRIEATD